MMRRTTVTADDRDFTVLEEEARRRGVSLAQVLREIVAEAASRRRADRPRPHLGIFRGAGSDVARRTAEDEEAPAAGRLRS